MERSVCGVGDGKVSLWSGRWKGQFVEWEMERSVCGVGDGKVSLWSGRWKGQFVEWEMERSVCGVGDGKVSLWSGRWKGQFVEWEMLSNGLETRGNGSMQPGATETCRSFVFVSDIKGGGGRGHDDWLTVGCASMISTLHLLDW